MGKFKVGDAVQLAWKSMDEYSHLVLNSFLLALSEEKSLRS